MKSIIRTSNSSHMKTLFLFISILIGSSLFGAVETFSNRIEGSSILVNASFDVYDDKYVEMGTNPSWPNIYTNYKVSNKVTLGLNKEVAQNNTFSNGTVDVRITYHTWNGVSFDQQIVTKTLTVSNTLNPLATIDDASTYSFSGAHFIKVEVIAISSQLSVGDIYLESEIKTERFYAFDGNAVAGVSYQIIGTNGNYIDFTWNTKAGAETYELEWVHVNDYGPNSSTFQLQSALNIDFYQNSTRITTKANHYKIPKIFDHGYVLFRVRAVGLHGSNFTVRKEGLWSAAETGTVATHPSAQKIIIGGEYDLGMNWAHQVAYTEDGKRMEGLSFVDGLGRVRQSVAHNTVTQQAVVSNIYYDEMGRPVISDLPTPKEGEELKHYPNFNRADASGEPSFMKDYFDEIVENSCEIISKGFSTNHGAGNYYSPSNPDRFDENANIPDAEKFPYSRVSYINDLSGRIKKSSSPGTTLKLGSGHETQYVYVSPNQTELDQLFGTEVGDKTHYEKLVTIDPNGQIYVTYADMAGRTIASYMAGQSPTALVALPENTGTQKVVPLMTNGAGQTLSSTNTPSAELTFTEYIYNAGNYRFNYGFTPQQYTSSCAASICLDCAYDLELTVLDDCGTEKWHEVKTINGQNFDAICNGATSYTYLDASGNAYKELNLTPGTYTIRKKLTVNQQAIEQYWCTYIENNSCVTPISTTFNGLYSAEEFQECNTIDLEVNEASDCDDYKEIMLTQMKPGHQYAGFTLSGTAYSCTDPSSIFYSGTTPILAQNWQSIGHYYDQNNNEIFVSINGAAPVSPATLTMQQFIENFDDSWALSLLNLHPEKCYLDFCYLSSGSNTFNASMTGEATYQGAKNSAFFKPIENATVDHTSFYLNSPFVPNYDPFFISGAPGAGQAAAMKNKMEHYVDFLLSNNTTMDLSIWEYALLISGCPNADATYTETQVNACIDLAKKDRCYFDLVWVNYRKMYLELKDEYVLLAQQAYATANGCSNACIGVATPCSAPNNVLADNISVFGNISQFGNAGTNSTDFNNASNEQIAAACQSTCEQYANDWIEKLAGCDFAGHNVNMTNFKNSLISLCTSGCNQNHPVGSSTSPTGTSIDDVLAQYGLTRSNLCTELLISEPAPYQSTDAIQDNLEIPLSSCACEKMEEADAAYTAALANPSTMPVGVTSKEGMLAFMTGVTMDDIDLLLCKCSNQSGQGWVASNGTMINPNYTVPQGFDCGEQTNAGCQTCQNIENDITSLLQQFPAYATLEAFSQAQNYEIILTNFINNQHFYNLSYQDYADFIAGCRATSSNPYCTVNPLANEWADIMKLVTFRGNLLNNSSQLVNLETDNIVYKHGKFKDLFAGDNYWSAINGNTLELHYGTLSNNGVITLTKDPAFEFSDIISFGTIVPLTNVCPNTNSTFQVEVQYLNCGVLTTAYLNGNSYCFEVNQCVCGNEGQTLCNDLSVFEEGECYQPVLDQLYSISVETYEQAVATQYQIFLSDYNSKCDDAFATENMAYQGTFSTYQYTLYYYDQAGNLVKTIAPQGIDLPFQSSTALTTVSTGRQLLTPVVPAHEYKTTYEYNSYDQLVNTGNPDQQGLTKFWYDYFGRIVASQNPVQAAENKYSYSLYDNLGRPIEVGQVVTSTVMTDNLAQAMDAVPGTTIAAWVAGGTRSEVTMTKYDKYYSTAIAAKFVNGQQENLRLRVASVLYFENGNDPNYTSATHYSYDIHGNVKEALQDVPMMSVVAQDIKSTCYEYELISGNVKKVSYQKGKADQMEHSYCYDDLNRLTEVFTSTNDVHKTREAHYRYYDYGPTARTEIGEYKVQGLDYNYTINGWMKGMNSSTLNVNRDIGFDGAASSTYCTNNPLAHTSFAADVVGYTIGYFDNDYKAIGAANQGAIPMEAAYSGTIFEQASANLYNGNIRHLVTSISGMQTMGTAYKYDQKNQLKEMRSYFNGNFTGNTWAGGTASDDYYNSYVYDRNGNITQLQRNSTSTIGLLMDNFDYKYTGLDGLPNSSSTSKSNRLNYVIDNGANDAANSGDIKAGMNTNNYTYDAIGELTGDVAEGIQTINWRRGDKKVKSIIRSAAKPDASQMEFMYNPFGQRIVKIEKPRSGGVLSAQAAWKYSYYSYDANGQAMAIYEATMAVGANTATLEERPVYGTGRLGEIKAQVSLYNNGVVVSSSNGITQNTVGNRAYEITNHLGNVNALISDRKMLTAQGAPSSYEVIVLMKADYYPFGMEMPGRNVTTANYRYGYNGMEKDKEIKGDGNSYTTEFRQYDPRLGRWLSLDPLMAQFPWMSPYVGFDNNPVLYNDIYGLSTGKGNPNDYGVEPETGGDDKARAEGWGGPEDNDPEDDGPGPKNKDLNVVPASSTKVVLNYTPIPPLNTSPYAKKKEEVLTPKKPDNIDGGEAESIQFAKQIGKDYKEVFEFAIPGVELIHRLQEGEEVGVTDILIEGASIIPVGKLLSKGGKLFLKVGDKTTDITTKTIRTKTKKALDGLCFVAGTKIAIENGLKNIEEIKVGDLVWSYSDSLNKKSLKLVYNIVVRTSDHLHKLVIGNDTISTTDDHPFYVSHTWKRADDLKVGDTLTLLNGDYEILTFKERIDTIVTVYNFAVEEYHTYYVGEKSILVHNNNPCAAVIKKQSGWVVSKIFNKLDPAIQKKVAAAIEKGIVAPTDAQGIIKLTASEAKSTGYSYKIKILGKGGDIRIYGNMDANGHIVFDKIGGH